jgi:hypothetical protein
MEAALPISIPVDRIAELCRTNGIRRLSLFGSVLRGDFTPESDVDVLVEFESGRVPGLIGLQRIESELSAMLGRRVDLNTPGFLSGSFREQVMAEARPILVAA